MGHTARALLRLAFATAPTVSVLTSPLRSNSLAHSPKGTPSHIPATEVAGIVLRLVVGSRFQVLFHSPHWGAFHLSLTVLVHYRSSNVFSLGKWTSQIPTGLACPVVLRNKRRSLDRFRLRGYHPLRPAFPVPLNYRPDLSLLGVSAATPTLSYNPRTATPAGYHAVRVWAFPFSLATTQGIISFPRGT
jgi:hypothetical protein